MASGDPQLRHYFADDPDAPSRRRTVELTLPDLSARLISDGSVFSADRVDPGTKILLTAAPFEEIGGPVLDLGCGYGPIAVALANRMPRRTVLAVDVNQRALALAAENLADLPNAEVRHADDVDPELRFETIYSNPPIRIGKAALHELLERWLDRLTPSGRAYLVAQKHLGSDSLASWLGDSGWATERLTSRQGYRVLAVGARRRVDR